MPSDSMPWFRHYSEDTRDVKLQMICRELGVPFVIVYGSWSFLMALANESPHRGLLYVTLQKRYTKQELAYRLQMDAEQVETVLNKFIEYDMLTLEDGAYKLINWDKRQFKSDSSAARVQKHRQSKAKDENPATQGETRNGDVTLQKRYCNAPDTEADTDTDTEAEAESSAAAEKTDPQEWQPSEDGVFHGEGEERVYPETPLEAEKHPDLKPIRAAVGLIPGRRDYRACIDAIQILRRTCSTDEALVTYLKPYYYAWTNRQRKVDGKGYEPLNMGWLLDWAVNGHIPSEVDPLAGRAGKKPIRTLRGDDYDIEVYDDGSEIRIPKQQQSQGAQAWISPQM